MIGDEALEASNMDRRGWHVGKEIPIALVAVLGFQTVGFIWSIAGLYNRVDNLSAAIAEMKTERYTKEDARAARELATFVNESQRQRDIEQDRRITILESLVNQVRSPK